MLYEQHIIFIVAHIISQLKRENSILRAKVDASTDSLLYKGAENSSIFQNMISGILTFFLRWSGYTSPRCWQWLLIRIWCLAAVGPLSTIKIMHRNNKDATCWFTYCWTFWGLANSIIYDLMANSYIVSQSIALLVSLCLTRKLFYMNNNLPLMAVSWHLSLWIQPF